MAQWAAAPHGRRDVLKVLLGVAITVGIVVTVIVVLLVWSVAQRGWYFS